MCSLISESRAGEVVSLYEFGADDMGYLCLPEKQPQGSILLIPDSFGPRGVVKQRCSLLAKLGYVTLAVDLYNGNVSEHPEVARRYQERLDFDAAVKTIQAGMKLLSESPRYKTETVLVAVWGENLEAMITASEGLETFAPDGVSWLEPDTYEDLASMIPHQLPFQMILRQETLDESYHSHFRHFNQLRGIDSEVVIIERERGFLLEPESSPQGVEAWSALINFWEQVTSGEYQPSLVSGGEALRQMRVPQGTRRSEPSRSILSRPGSRHPRLR